MRLVALALLALFTAGCVPVQDPARWDGHTYCRTVQQIFGVDEWCATHGR